MRRCTPWTSIAVALAAVFAFAMPSQAQTAKADAEALLNAIPADATAFVAVRNLKEFDAKITEFSEVLGFPLGGENAMMPSALDWLKENIMLDDEINEAGALAVVLLNCADLESAEMLSSRAVVMVPVADVKKMAVALEATEENGVYSFQIGADSAVATMKSGFFVMAESTDSLKLATREGKGIATALTDNRKKAFAENDILAWFSTKGVSKAIREEVGAVVTGMMMMGAMDNPEAGQLRAANMVEQIERIATEADVISVGVNVNAAKGIAANFYMSVKPDSMLGEQMKEIQMPTEPLLIGLPDESVIATLGAVGNASGPIGQKEMQKGLDQTFSEELFGGELTAEQVTALKDGLMKCLVPLKAMNVSIAELPIENGQGMIGVVSVLTVENAKTYQKSVRDLGAFFKSMVVDIAKGELEAEDLEAVEKAFQIKEGAETIGGAVVDHIFVDVSQIPDADEADIEQMKVVAGPEGLLVRIAAVDATHVAVMFGGGKERCEQVFKSIAEKKAPLADNRFTKMVQNRIPAPDQRMAEGYLHLENIVKLVIDVMNEAGDQPFPFPLMIPETAPLTIATTRLSDVEMRSDMLIPMEFVTTVKDAIQPMLGMMMGGMMGGPPMPMDEEPEPLEDDGGLN